MATEEDADEMIVNPNCYIRLIYEYIKIKADVPDGMEIDLCDNKGVLKKIYEPPYYKSGLEILEQRESYYLVLLKVEKTNKVVPVPYMNSTHVLYEQLVKKLEVNRSPIKLNVAYPNKDFSEMSSSPSSNKSISGDSSTVIVTQTSKKKKKSKDAKARNSNLFPGFIDKNQQINYVMFPPAKKIYDGRKIFNNLNKKKVKGNKILCSPSRKNWYISPSDESLKNTNRKRKQKLKGSVLKY